MNITFLTWLIDQLGRILEPLEVALGSEAEFAALMERYGWRVDPKAFAIADVQSSFAIAADVAHAAQLLDDTADPGAQGIASLEQYVELAQVMARIIGNVRDLTSRPAPAGLPATAWEDFAVALLDGLFIDYLEGYKPALVAFLVLTGAVSEMTVDPVDTPGRLPYVKKTVDWIKLIESVAHPDKLAQQAVSWNQSGEDFDSTAMLSRLAHALPLIGLDAKIHAPTPALLDAYYGPGNPSRNAVQELRISVLRDGDAITGAVTFDYSLSILPIPPAGQPGAKPAGFTLGPLLTAPAGIPSSVYGFYQLEIAGGFQNDGGIRLDVLPGHIALNLGGGTGQVNEMVAIAPSAPSLAVLLGTIGSNRLEVTSWTVRLRVMGAASDPELRVEVAIEELAVVIDTADADGLLQKILGAGERRIQASVDVIWSSRTGLGFSGNARLEATIPLDLSIADVLTIDSLHLALALSSGGRVAIEITASGRFDLGPVAASIDRVGIQATFTSVPPGQKPGLFGDVDVGFGFKPPHGLGINLDAGPITGGGFIEFDPDNGRYAGVLALSLYSIQVKAIGLLDTKMPGGQSGYSFLVIISVEFTPIQLGFGITLNGVGGLCGINRNFVTDALRAGLRQHSLDHILFPKDPVKNAPAIISDLRAIFPPAEGRYVFGPMLELGWGGGLNLVTVEIGVILALPSPVVIAILGQLNVNLPSPDAAVVELHLDVLGIIDFGKKLFSLDASLHDSRIAVFTIYGDMAMRLSWGNNPSFALSIGGLNPCFQPPAGFPTLKRLTIALSASENFRLTIQTYFAITSNSFQLGAHAELYIGVSEFNVYGWLGFDALLIFEPFSFVVDFTAGLAFRSGNSTLMGISISGELSGPTPWHAKGEAHVTLLFFDIGVHVDTTWGESRQIDAPHTDAWPQLHDAIANLGNWSGALPQGTPAVVTLAKPAADTKTTVLADPSGALTMRERVCPLDQTLTKFGEAVPGPQNIFSLDAVSLGGQPVSFTKIRDKFAPAQFEQMPDQDKLSRPSFEDRTAGFSVGDGLVTIGHGFGLDLAFEDVYVDDKAPPPPSNPVLYRPSLNLQAHWALSNAAAKSALHQVAMGSYAPPVTTAPLVTMSDEYFVVATTTDLTQRADITQPTTKGEAYQALAAHLSSNPAERDQLQVLPLHELAL